MIVSPEWGLALSRYLHLNPVRVGQLGLSKAHRQQQRPGAEQKPARDQVEQRIQLLRSYRWSSYRSYIGPDEAPEWLEKAGVLRLGGGRKAEWAECYVSMWNRRPERDWGAESPWESVRANYGVVATNSRRYELSLERDRAEKRRMAEVLRLLNCDSGR